MSEPVEKFRPGRMEKTYSMNEVGVGHGADDEGPCVVVQFGQDGKMVPSYRLHPNLALQLAERLVSAAKAAMLPPDSN